MVKIIKNFKKNFFLLFSIWSSLLSFFYYFNKIEIYLDPKIFLSIWIIGIIFLYQVFIRIKRLLNIKVMSEEEELSFEYFAKYDTLTAIPNRTYILEMLEKLLNKARRYDEKFALFFIDLDDFKTVNDTLGHHIGDLLLKEVSLKIKSALRNYDKFGRYAGDEFILIVEQTKSEDDIISIAKKIRTIFQDSFELDGNRINVSASIGISLFPLDGKDSKTLIKHADIAMYMAKNSGKNRCQFFTKEMNEKLKNSELLKENLKNAIKNNELELHYQPHINLSTGKILGAETLLRWRKNGELIYPNSFISIAEKSGLIIPMSHWILTESIKNIKEWQRKGKKITISVNISKIEFNNKNFLDKLVKEVKDMDLEPKSLELELSEELLSYGDMEKIKKIKDADICLIIDDFGKGCSSLSSIKECYIDMIKIDKELTDNIFKNSNTKEIISALIAMCHALNIKLIAKSIETKEQLEFFKSENFDFGQGYYFYRPLTKTEFEKLI